MMLTVIVPVANDVPTDSLRADVERAARKRATAAGRALVGHPAYVGECDPPYAVAGVTWLKWECDTAPHPDGSAS